MDLDTLTRQLKIHQVVDKFNWLTGCLTEVRKNIGHETRQKTSVDFKRVFGVMLGEEKLKTQRVIEVAKTIADMQIIAPPVKKRPKELSSLR